MVVFCLPVVCPIAVPLLLGSRANAAPAFSLDPQTARIDLRDAGVGAASKFYCATVIMCNCVIVMCNCDTFPPKWHPAQGRIVDERANGSPVAARAEPVHSQTAPVQWSSWRSVDDNSTGLISDTYLLPPK